LSSYFRSLDLPFEPGLVRDEEHLKCHIWYEPSVKDFRADPDNNRIEGIQFHPDTLGFLSGRTEVVGDVLDIAKVITWQVSRPLEITLGLYQELDLRWYEAALDLHFRSVPHSFLIRNTSSVNSLPWVQDFLKSGKVNGTSFILTPRLLYEGRAEDGETFRPYLETFSETGYGRSRLSWEGGDLQFLRDATDPSRLLLFFGAAAKSYWGQQLSMDEYAYVLKLEFGADDAVDLSGLALHVDYFVSFLPEENIALVSDPITGNLEIARGALQVIGQRLTNPYDGAILRLARDLSISAEEFQKDRRRIREALEELKKAAPTVWAAEEKRGLRERLEAYILANCGDDPNQCFSPEVWERMLERDLPLLHDWVTGAIVARTDVPLFKAMLSVIESQLPGYEITNRELRERKIRELESLGLKVIRVPRIAGDAELRLPWAGVSYVNNLLVNKTLFVPSMGFPVGEDGIFESLQHQLPPGYRVIPIYARHLILNNGGLHCAAGIIRAGDSED
jgi:hypothetical protein